MAFKYSGDATIGVSFNPQTPKPLDIRTVVTSTEDLYNIPKNIAYRGMTVANISNGNIYMLVDENKITEKSGWKASYESILIIACTEQEYKEWQANTTSNYQPIDENKTSLHLDTYYYIFEDSMDINLEYLSAGWGQRIEELIKNLALNSTVVSISNKVKEIAANYLSESDAHDLFLRKEYVNNELVSTLDKYYTKELSNIIFVTKDSLGNDFNFITKNQYDIDLELIKSELSNTLKTNEDGSLNSITVSLIKDPNSSTVIDVTQSGLKIGDNLFATLSEVPVIVTINLNDYDLLIEDGNIDENTYYYTYGNVDIRDTGYVRNEYLVEKYYDKKLIDEKIIIPTYDVVNKAIYDNYYNIANYTKNEISEHTLIIESEDIIGNTLKSVHNNSNVIGNTLIYKEASLNNMVKDLATKDTNSDYFTKLEVLDIINNLSEQIAKLYG